MFGTWLRPRIRALGRSAAVLGWGLVCLAVAFALPRPFANIAGNAYAFFGLFGLAVGAVLFYGGWRAVHSLGAARASRMGKELAAWVSRHGWQAASTDGVLPARGFPFSLAGEHSVLQVVRGPFRGREAMFMRYRIQGVSGSESAAYNFAVVAIAADADFAATVALPQRGWNSVASRIGLEDIDVESKDFNDRWRLVGRDRGASHAIMQPRVIERLLADDAGGYAVTWDASTILVANYADSLDVTVLEPQLHLLSDLAELVPGYMSKGDADARDLHLVHPPRTFITRREGFVTVMLPCLVLVGAGFVPGGIGQDAAVPAFLSIVLICAAAWLVVGLAWTSHVNQRRRRSWFQESRRQTPPT